MDKQQNLFMRSYLQSINLFLGLVLIYTIVLIIFFFHELFTGSWEQAVFNSHWLLDTSMEPFLHPINWSFNETPSVINLFIDGIVFSLLYAFSFWVYHKQKYVGDTLFIFVSLAVICWYYIYLLGFGV